MERDPLDKLLAIYRFWGFFAMGAFSVFVFLLLYIVNREGPLNFPLLFLSLACGFIWIGATSFSRHIFVLLKGYIGSRVTVIEFLSTQFVAILFPVLYLNVRRKAEIFRSRVRETRR